MALGLDTSTIATLVNADLLVAGVITSWRLSVRERGLQHGWCVLVDKAEFDDRIHAVPPVTGSA
ncbi:hypothetical protein ACPESR_26970 [Nocardia testacea]|uniref:hypothetical protein n=1 Tax=Nocardia testacea TaxID=248551 RepID=UPI003C2C85B9